MINVYMDGCVRVGKPGEHKFLPVDKIPKQHIYIYICSCICIILCNYIYIYMCIYIFFTYCMCVQK